MPSPVSAPSSPTNHHLQAIRDRIRSNNGNNGSHSVSPKGPSQSKSPGTRRRTLKNGNTTSKDIDIDSSLQKSVNNSSTNNSKREGRSPKKSSPRKPNNNNHSNSKAVAAADVNHTTRLEMPFFAAHEEQEANTPKATNKTNTTNTTTTTRKERRRSSTSSPSRKQKSKSTSSTKKGRYKAARSHSPVGRNRRSRKSRSKSRSKSTNNYDTTTTTTPSSSAADPLLLEQPSRRPKSESSLDVSKNSYTLIPVDFNDDTGIGTDSGQKKQKKERRGRRQQQQQSIPPQSLPSLQDNNNNNKNSNNNNNNSSNNNNINSGSLDRSGRSNMSNLQQEEMETELAQMLGSINGYDAVIPNTTVADSKVSTNPSKRSAQFNTTTTTTSSIRTSADAFMQDRTAKSRAFESKALDTTSDSRASVRSGKSKKKSSSRNHNKSSKYQQQQQQQQQQQIQIQQIQQDPSESATPENPSKKSVRITPLSPDEGEQGEQPESVPPLPTNDSKSPKQRTKSLKSSTSKNSTKSKKKSKKNKDDTTAAAATTAQQQQQQQQPQPPARKTRKPKHPAAVALEQERRRSSSSDPKKTKKKKSKSPTPAGLQASSNHNKGSSRNNKKDTSGKSASHTGRSTVKSKSNGSHSHSNSRTAKDKQQQQQQQRRPSPLKRSKSLDPNPLIPTGQSRRPASRRPASERDLIASSARSAPSQNRLRRAKSLFGAVLNPKGAGAETVGDGDNSDNENNEGKQGFLGWAKKKMQSSSNNGKLSPGFRKKRGLRVGGRSGNGNDNDDNQGLLSNAEDRGGQMSLLNLTFLHNPEEEKKRKTTKKAAALNTLGEDNEIQEKSNEFSMPHLTAKSNGVHKKTLKPVTATAAAAGGNKRSSMASEANSLRNSAIIDHDRPPFSQIIATSEMPAEEDDLSDIGDPEANIRLVAPEIVIPEILNEDEIVFEPERNDVLYQDKTHPGTVQMLHVLREIIMEHQDDIVYSPEVYKVIKRRLKGRKFLLQSTFNKQKVWREASKSENVGLLADYFNEEMRQLGFGGADELEESDRKPAVRKRMDSAGANSGLDGSIRDNLLSKAIAECIWAQEIAKPQGDIDMMNIGIDAEEKLINLIEIAESGSTRTQPLKEELDKLGELAKQMMYVSIAPLYERLDEIEERMADYFDQENAVLDEMDADSENLRARSVGSRSFSIRDRSMEKDGESYEVDIKNASYDDSISFDDADKEPDDDDDDDEIVEVEEVGVEEEYVEEEYIEVEVDEEHQGDEYVEESDEGSATNMIEGEVLNCDITEGDVSSVGGSGLYGSEDDDSALEDGEQPNWIDFGDDNEAETDEESHTNEGTNRSSDEDSEVSAEPQRRKSIFEEPNPKMKQFFDRLNHFFETRKRIEERAASKDPGNKSLKIKPKTHSGGISNKNGAYKAECQQRDTNNKVVRNLDDLYDAARAAYPDFKSIVQQLVDEIIGHDYKDNIILPKLKSRDRAYEKATTEYSNRDLGPPESWLYDICRAGIVCNTVKQLSEVSKWLTSNSHVVQAKNRFADPVFNGYRDLLYHVSISYGDGRSHICEIQVHLKAIYDLNGQCGTIKHYDYFRSSFSNPWRSQEDALSDLEKMNKYTKIEGPFMKRLLKSEDSEQLLLFAEILRKNLEENERALELYRRVLGLQEDAHGSDNPEMAATYQSIGLVLGAMGDTDESLQNLLKALAIQEDFLGADHVEVADSYVEIGHMLSKRGDYSGAYTQYQRTQLIRENRLGKEHFLVIKSIQDIGLVLQKKGDLKESENEYRKALAIQKDVLGEDHMDIATTRSFIGKTLCLYGDFEGAMVEDKLALSMREKSLGKNHRSTADSHSAIGVLLFNKGDYKTSRWHHNKALKIRESRLGKDDGECAISHRHLGELLSYAEGDYEGAVKALKRAQEILEANVGMDNPVTANSYLDLGHIHLRHGKHQEALTEYRRAKVILESNLGQTHPDTAGTYMCTGDALNLAGERDEALRMHRKALVVLESVLGNSHPRTADGYQSTGDVFVASGNPELALSEYREALKIRKSVLRKDHPSVAESCSRIGKILLTGCDGNGNTEKRDPEGALEIFREALTITEERCGINHPSVAAARLDVSLALMALANDVELLEAVDLLEEAEEQLTATLSVLREIEPLGEDKTPTRNHYLGFGDEAAITGKTCVSLGTVKEKRGNSEGARAMFVEGLERLISVLGGNHPDTVKIESKLLLFVAES